MLAVVRYPGLARGFLLVFMKVLRMSSRTGNWMIAAGVVALIMGLLTLPAALGEHMDTSLLTLGACGVSLGSMIAAAGFYLKARAMALPEGSTVFSGESRQSSRRVRGGCDLCHGDLPVIHCKVHQVHLCPDCVAKHYDFRSCTYIPSTRGTPPKTAKALAKAQGA
jgi:hypothetical protein